VGAAIEIVPMVNPCDLKSGDYFQFKLLCQGKPVAENVFATYAGFSSDGAWAYTTRTNNDWACENDSAALPLPDAWIYGIVKPLMRDPNGHIHRLPRPEQGEENVENSR
jgi:hypothetical protein